MHPLADRFVKVAAAVAVVAVVAAAVVAAAVVLRLQITDWRPLPNSAGSAAAAASDCPPNTPAWPLHPGLAVKWSVVDLVIIKYCIMYKL